MSSDLVCASVDAWGDHCHTASLKGSPIDQAARSIGIDKSIVASCVVLQDSLVAATRIKAWTNQSPPLHCLLDMQDIRPGRMWAGSKAIAQKGPTKVLVSNRTFVYARINQDSDCTEAAQVLALEREVKLIVESDVAASQFSPPYMYAIEIAAQDDYNRPGVDTLLALVVTRKIDRIVVWRADRLFSPDAFALFTRLCNQNNVSIVSVARN